MQTFKEFESSNFNIKEGPIEISQNSLYTKNFDFSIKVSAILEGNKLPLKNYNFETNELTNILNDYSDDS